MIDDIKKVPQAAPPSHQDRSVTDAEVTPSQTKHASLEPLTTGRQTNKENYQVNNKQPQNKSKGRPTKTKNVLDEAPKTVQQFQPQQPEKVDMGKTSSTPRQPLK